MKVFLQGCEAGVFSDPEAIPCMLPSLHVEMLGVDTLYLLSERSSRQLRGRNLAALVRAIDGKRTVASLELELSAEISVPGMHYLLDRLHAQGYVLDARHMAEERARDAFWELMALPKARVPLSANEVCIQVLGNLTIQPLQMLLEQSGINVSADAALKVLLVEDYLGPEVPAYLAQQTGPVLLAQPCATRILVGPLLTPGHGACWTCLAFWLHTNRPVHALLRRVLGQSIVVPKPVEPMASAVAHGLVAIAVKRYLAGDRQMADQIELFDLARMQMTHHRLVQRPQCPACGDSGWMRRQARTALVLRPQQTVHDADGGYRSVTPEETLVRYRHLINPVCGPVSYLHPMPERYSALRKVYVSGYLVCPSEVAEDLSFDRICAGKGLTDEQAQASALCEALERFSSIFQGDEAVRHASFSEIGGAALDLNALQNFSVAQFLGRAAINAKNSDRRRQVPEPFGPDVGIDWTPGWSLTCQESRQLPLVYCFSETPPESGKNYAIYNPNGTAAGNCLEEAVLQGFLELIERDAVAIWWYNRVRRPAVNFDEFQDPYFALLAADYAAQGWRLWVLDLTHDLGVPVCAALAHHAILDRYAIGFGCHLDRKLAIKRSLTELNQLLDKRPEAPPPWDRSVLPETAFLEAVDVPIMASRCPPEPDLLVGIQHCVKVMAEAGMESIVVNKTRPDIGLSVVQVVVPGLRHFWPRFGPGRLYEVPVSLGWLTTPTPEALLNPAPLFL